MFTTPNDYKGNAASVGLTASLADKGITVGYFWPADVSPLTSNEPQGVFVGYAPGAALSLWYAVSLYQLTWSSTP